MKGDLASHGEPFGLSERKVGDILTSLGLTNRSRTNAGYLLWLERPVRVRIHEMARDYEADGTHPNQDCDICKETNTASPVSSTLGAAEENQGRSDEAKGARRARRERDPATATRAANSRAKQAFSIILTAG
jgi:hypothetical protein